jgi:hypothetical protein
MLHFAETHDSTPIMLANSQSACGIAPQSLRLFWLMQNPAEESLLENLDPREFTNAESQAAFPLHRQGSRR